MNNLERIRIDNNLSQNELAKKANISQSVVSDLESGRTKNPRIDTARAIANVLGCTIDSLFEESETD